MINPERHRKQIVERVLPQSEMLGLMIESIATPMTYDHLVVAPRGEAFSAIPAEEDTLVGGVYIAAQLASHEVQYAWLGLRNADPERDRLRTELIQTAISRPDRLNHRGVLTKSLTNFAVGTALDDKGIHETFAAIGGLEVRATTDRDGRLRHYMTLSSARLLRRSTRTVSEQVLGIERLQRKGGDLNGAKIPPDYRDFSFNTPNVDEAGQRVAFSAFYHLLADVVPQAEPADATIDTEPRDTH